MVIAIDGPAGAGKSTVARAVADALGFAYLDSGAMYRCVALAELRGAADPVECAIELGDRITLDGEDVTEAIRAPQVSARASEVAARPHVRSRLVERQRELGNAGRWREIFELNRDVIEDPDEIFPGQVLVLPT